MKVGRTLRLFYMNIFFNKTVSNHVFVLHIDLCLVLVKMSSNGVIDIRKKMLKKLHYELANEYKIGQTNILIIHY